MTSPGAARTAPMRPLDEAASWVPDCITSDEWARWMESNHKANSDSSRARRPCDDCTLGFALEQRAIGRCNGTPAGVEADETELDDEWAAHVARPDRALLRLLADAVHVAPPVRPDGRVAVFGRFVPAEVAIEPQPQPGDLSPVDIPTLLGNVRRVGFAAVIPAADHASVMHQEEDPMPAGGNPKATEPTTQDRRIWEAVQRLGYQVDAAKELGIKQGSVQSGLRRYMELLGIPGPMPGKLTPEENARRRAAARGASPDHVPAAPDLVVAEHAEVLDAPSVDPQSGPIEAAIDPVIAPEVASEPAVPLVAEAQEATPLVAHARGCWPASCESYAEHQALRVPAADVTPPARSDDPAPETQTLVAAWRLALDAALEDMGAHLRLADEAQGVVDYLERKLADFA